MNLYRYSRTYVGPVKACVLDWSGTTVDKYVLSPAAVFVELFGKHQVSVSIEEARRHMGLPKDKHIEELTRIPAVRQRWQDVHGAPPTDSDMAAMFRDFEPTQKAILSGGRYSAVLPGVLEGIDRLRRELDVKIGLTTGFVRVMGDVMKARAKEQGFEPDADVCRDEVKHGWRPSPAMLHRCLDLLGVPQVQAVVKVDDSTQGMEEALNGGCWAVGVARYSAYLGIECLEDEAALSPEEVERRCRKARDNLWRAGAHYVSDSLDQLPDVVMDINDRLAKGEKP